MAPFVLLSKWSLWLWTVAQHPSAPHPEHICTDAPVHTAASTDDLSSSSVSLAASPTEAQKGSRSTVKLVYELEGVLNINTASAEEWVILPGIGPATAAKLIEYRSHRPFSHPAHVMRIKGIGRKTYDRIRDHLTTVGETTLARVARPILVD